MIEWEGRSLILKGWFISDLRSKKLISKEFICHLVHVKNSNSEIPSLEFVVVVNEFSKVFSYDFPGISPNKEIDLGNDLQPDTRPIFFPPYKLGLAELDKLKK